MQNVFHMVKETKEEITSMEEKQGVTREQADKKKKMNQIVLLEIKHKTIEI